MTKPVPASPPIATFEKLTWPQLQKLGKEFLDILPTATVEEARAALSCFQSGYLDCRYNLDDPREVLAQDVAAPALLRILSRKYLEHEFELTRAEHATEDEPVSDAPSAP